MVTGEVVKQRIGAAFAANNLKPDIVREIAFHMTDWGDDLNELVALFNNIDHVEDEKIRKVVIKFLAHVPNHVAAAKKLVGLGPIEDVFRVGVLEEDT